MDAFAVVGFVAFVAEVVLGVFRGIVELIERCVATGDQQGWNSSSETHQEAQRSRQGRQSSNSSTEQQTDQTFGIDWDREFR